MCRSPSFPLLPCHIQHLLAAAVLNFTVIGDIVLQAQLKNFTFIPTMNGTASQWKCLKLLWRNNMYHFCELQLVKRSSRATKENSPCEQISAEAAELGFIALSSLLHLVKLDYKYQAEVQITS